MKNKEQLKIFKENNAQLISENEKLRKENEKTKNKLFFMEG